MCIVGILVYGCERCKVKYLHLALCYNVIWTRVGEGFTMFCLQSHLLKAVGTLPGSCAEAALCCVLLRM